MRIFPYSITVLCCASITCRKLYWQAKPHQYVLDKAVLKFCMRVINSALVRPCPKRELLRFPAQR